LYITAHFTNKGSAMSISNIRTPAPVQIICLGLSRTGTTSLSEALDILGFGPCYHTYSIIIKGKTDFDAWFKISDGLSTPEEFDAIFQGYHAVLDEPAAHFPGELYAAYPDAKFILTTRDPDKWVTSVQNTIFPTIGLVQKMKDRTPVNEFFLTWFRDHLLKKFYGPDTFTNPKRIILEHNENVERIIPEDKLLVYQVGEGWARLCQFLNVDVPHAPFPRLNDSESWRNIVLTPMEKKCTK